MEYSATMMDCQTMENISERLRATIEHELDGKKRTLALEATTGIAGETWRKFLTGKQNGTLLMLEAICKQWPEYAFWIATGATDENFGHTMPGGRPRKHSKSAQDTASPKYFAELLKDPQTRAGNDQSVRDALLVLQNMDLIDLTPRETEEFGRVDLFEKIRLISIFLDNYLLELNIDDAIAAFNHMTSNTKKLAIKADSIGERNAIDELLGKFTVVKSELELRRNWIIESATGNQDSSSKAGK